MATTQVSGTDDQAPEGPPRRRVPMALVTWVFVILILSIVVVLLVVKITRGSTTVEPPPVAPASPGVVHAATSVPSAAFDGAGADQATDPGQAVLSGQPALTIAGRPAVVYVGGEFCPYCAAERWVLVTALGRFGSFSHLGATTSSATEIFGGTPTFTFDGTTYHSRYLTFAAVEEYGDRPSDSPPAGFPKLQDPTPVEEALLRRYDAEPYVPGTGTFPFVDVDNRLVISGAGIGFSPGVLQGRSMAQIAGDLSDPTNADAEAILGAADTVSAEICAATGGRPASVCTSAGVEAGASRLGLR